uniref:Uncharacterized protein n=1 Tax=Manihot esculenta TaxID=3983 RepID=A0A2C9W3H7_MANES
MLIFLLYYKCYKIYTPSPKCQIHMLCVFDCTVQECKGPEGLEPKHTKLNNYNSSMKQGKKNCKTKP